VAIHLHQFLAALLYFAASAAKPPLQIGSGNLSKDFQGLIGGSNNTASQIAFHMTQTQQTKGAINMGIKRRRKNPQGESLGFLALTFAKQKNQWGNIFFYIQASRISAGLKFNLTAAVAGT